MLNIKNLPVVFLSDTDMSPAVAHAVKAGLIRKVGLRIYTTNMRDDLSHIVRQNWMQLVSLLLPGCVLSHRTALEASVSAKGNIYVSGGYLRTIKLHDITIVQMVGAGPVEGDTPLLDAFLPSRARAFLENLSPSRVRQEGESKNVPREEIERRLVDLLHRTGEEELNRLRDMAKKISPLLGMGKELSALDSLIGTLLGTRSEALTHGSAIAHKAGLPYDQNALKRVEALWRALVSDEQPLRPLPAVANSSFYNAAFFDSYFSNYIEGTRFEVGAAKRIIDTGEIPVSRPADAHDILGTYRVVGSLENMRRTPDTAEKLLELLCERHSEILSGRSEKRPGRFKVLANFAGTTKFVEPHLVKGTLYQGFEIYKSLNNPMAKALLVMFLVAEVHPFDDGNGRLARAMLNAELVSAEQTRIFIPSVFRNEYIASLKRLTNHCQPEAFIRVMSFAQDFVSRISFDSYEEAREQMHACNAFEDPADDKRLLMPEQINTN